MLCILTAHNLSYRMIHAACVCAHDRAGDGGLPAPPWQGRPPAVCS